MQCQLLSIALFSASLLGACAIATPGNAAQSNFQERESNNIQATTTSTVRAGDTLLISGSSQSGDPDLYSFRLNQKAKSFTLQAVSRGMKRRLYEDTNRNRRIDSSDRLLNIGTGEVTEIVKGGSRRYLISLTSSTRSSYVQMVSASESGLKPIKVGLLIKSAKALSRFDPRIPFTNKDRADFFVSGRVANRTLFITSRTAKSNQNNPTFDKFGEISVSANQREVPIEIRLADSDSGTAREQADISPDTRERTLKLKYRPATQEVIGPDGRRLGFRDQLITVQGNSSKHLANITFAIRSRTQR